MGRTNRRAPTLRMPGFGQGPEIAPQNRGIKNNCFLTRPERGCRTQQFTNVAGSHTPRPGRGGRIWRRIMRLAVPALSRASYDRPWAPRTSRRLGRGRTLIRLPAPPGPCGRRFQTGRPSRGVSAPACGRGLRWVRSVCGDCVLRERATCGTFSRAGRLLRERRASGSPPPTCGRVSGPPGAGGSPLGGWAPPQG